MIDFGVRIKFGWFGICEWMFLWDGMSVILVFIDVGRCVEIKIFWLVEVLRDCWCVIVWIFDGEVLCLYRFNGISLDFGF